MILLVDYRQSRNSYSVFIRLKQCNAMNIMEAGRRPLFPAHSVLKQSSLFPDCVDIFIHIVHTSSRPTSSILVGCFDTDNNFLVFIWVSLKDAWTLITVYAWTHSGAWTQIIIVMHGRTGKWTRTLTHRHT